MTFRSMRSAVVQTEFLVPLIIKKGIKMKWANVLFLVIPILNIALNTLSLKTARREGDFFDVILSPTFGLTILVGTASVISMVALYRSGVSLPKGILFMGAISILIGSLWGIWTSNVKFNGLEWWLFLSIALFMFARFYRFVTISA